MSVVMLVLLPFMGSIVTALLPTRARTVLAGWAGLVSTVAAVWVISLFPRVRDGGVIRETISWVPSLGLDLMFRIDGFAWMFAVLVTVIGALVSLYARYYMSPEDPVARFYAFFLAFMGAMLGVVLSGNLVQLVVFWELTSLVSFLLIGYWHHRVDAQRGARMALTVTGAGGLALLGGVVILGHIVGSYDLDVVLASGDRVRAHRALPGRARADPARRVHEERPVPVPLLAAAGDGGADAGVRLPALGDHGEGGRVSARAALAGALGDRAVVLARQRRGHDHAPARRVHRDVPERSEARARVLDRQPPRPHHAPVRAQQPARGGRRRVPHHESRDVQGLAVHGRGHRRSRDRARATSGA